MSPTSARIRHRDRIGGDPTTHSESYAERISGGGVSGSSVGSAGASFGASQSISGPAGPCKLGSDPIRRGSELQMIPPSDSPPHPQAEAICGICKGVLFLHEHEWLPEGSSAPCFVDQQDCLADEQQEELCWRAQHDLTEDSFVVSSTVMVALEQQEPVVGCFVQQTTCVVGFQRRESSTATAVPGCLPNPHRIGTRSKEQRNPMWEHQPWRKHKRSA